MAQRNFWIESLRRDLGEAVIKLAPKFAILDEELRTYPIPSFEIVKEKGVIYDPINKKFTFDSESIWDVYAFGEEASHYLHCELNPIHEKKFQYRSKEYWSAMNLLELVGHYGAMIYATEKRVKISTVKELCPTNVVFDTREQLEDYWGHKEGYSRAEKIFAEYGDSLLSRIARMSVEEALEILPRLAPVSLYERRILPFLDKMKGKNIKQPTVKLGN